MILVIIVACIFSVHLWSNSRGELSFGFNWRICRDRNASNIWSRFAYRNVHRYYSCGLCSQRFYY